LVAARQRIASAKPTGLHEGLQISGELLCLAPSALRESINARKAVAVITMGQEPPCQDEKVRFSQMAWEDFGTLPFGIRVGLDRSAGLVAQTDICVPEPRAEIRLLSSQRTGHRPAGQS